MSSETDNEVFRTNVLAEIKSIIEELHELKNFKRELAKKSTKRKPARKSKAKRKTVKRKPARKSKAKRKTNRRRQVLGKPNYLTNLCPNQYEYS